ncbi:hypothetical protein DJ480_21925 [Pseudomonas sp. Leaf98]|nr:hypothetical protein DJ480_21925 [Pseudomonas sp. Leaf98]
MPLSRASPLPQGFGGVTDRSHAPRGNASGDALRHGLKSRRRASRAVFPRKAWERSALGLRTRNAL